MASRDTNGLLRPAGIAFVLAILGTGCAMLKPTPPASDVRSAPDFTSGSVQAGGLGVVGMIGLASPGGDSSQVRAARSEAAARLWVRLRGARKAWRVLKEGELIAALGCDEHEMLLAAYERTRPLAGEELAGRTCQVPEATRYLLFGAMELDTSTFEPPGYATGGGFECSDGTDRDVGYTVYTTSRTVVATFDIYDRVSHRFVWHGCIEEKRSEYRCEESMGFFGSLVAGALHLNSYPAPPVRIGMLDGIFMKLARALPRAD